MDHAEDMRTERPAVVRFVENVGRGWVPDTPGRLTSHDIWRLGMASVQARARYPGPVGELVQREIWAYRDFGHRFGGGGIVERIVAELLAGQQRSELPGSATRR